MIPTDKHSRERAHLRALRAALKGETPPEVQQALAKPSYQDLERQIELYKRVFRELKACRDQKCSLCSHCVNLIWDTADRKPRRDLRL